MAARMTSFPRRCPGPGCSSRRGQWRAPVLDASRQEPRISDEDACVVTAGDVNRVAIVAVDVVVRALLLDDEDALAELDEVVELVEGEIAVGLRGEGQHDSGRRRERGRPYRTSTCHICLRCCKASSTVPQSRHASGSRNSDCSGAARTKASSSPPTRAKRSSSRAARGTMRGPRKSGGTSDVARTKPGCASSAIPCFAPSERSCSRLPCPRMQDR